MNSFSHLIVGWCLRSYIKEEYGTKLSAARFLYWNIMTDFRKPYNALPHKADCWESRLKSVIEEMTSRKQAQGYFGPGDSGRLGVLCHFYADFFCHPHTAFFKGSGWQHIRYEFNLYKYMRKSFMRLSASDFSSVTVACQDAGRIFDHFESLQESYLQKKPSFENDVVYTLRACLGAVAAIIRASMTEPVSIRAIMP